MLPFSNNSNLMNPILANSFPNLVNPMLSNSNPNNMNMGMMNFSPNINNLNANFMNNNMMTNINMNANINNMNNNMNNINPNFNNMNQNFNQIPNNFGNNFNNNMNNFNENILINKLNNLNFNNYKETLYKEKTNYIVSDSTKLILNNNEINRGKLVANMTAVSPTLQCSICLDLVMTPVECQNCSKLFCKNCIDSWLINAKECPNKHPFVKKEELDEWVKKALGKIFLKCPYKGCKSDYNYKYWTDHLKKCPFKSKGVQKLNDETTEGEDEPFIWEIIQFFVKDIHGKTHTFELPLSTTVLELKEKLKEKTGFDVEAQRLTCNGKTMENPKMLEFYGLQKNQTIFQLARLKGGNLLF